VDDAVTLYRYKSADEDEEMAFHIRCLSPTLPSNRFYHLLNKQRFDEAMRLAETFGTDEKYSGCSHWFCPFVSFHIGGVACLFMLTCAILMTSSQSSRA